MVNKQRMVSRIPSPDTGANQDNRSESETPSPSPPAGCGCGPAAVGSATVSLPRVVRAPPPARSAVISWAWRATREAGNSRTVRCRVPNRSCRRAASSRPPFSPHVLALFPVEEASKGTRTCAGVAETDPPSQGRFGGRAAAAPCLPVPGARGSAPRLVSAWVGSPSAVSLRRVVCTTLRLLVRSAVPHPSSTNQSPPRRVAPHRLLFPLPPGRRPLLASPEEPQQAAAETPVCVIRPASTAQIHLPPPPSCPSLCRLLRGRGSAAKTAAGPFLGGSAGGGATRLVGFSGWLSSTKRPAAAMGCFHSTAKRQHPGYEDPVHLASQTACEFADPIP